MELVQLEDDLRNQLDAIWLRYQTNRDPQVKQEYRAALRQFSALIFWGKKTRPLHEA